jgi:hypothetical protein
LTVGSVLEANTFGVEGGLEAALELVGYGPLFAGLRDA